MTSLPSTSVITMSRTSITFGSKRHDNGTLVKLHYLIVPAIPLVAVWAFALAKSAGQFYALVDAAPASSAARPPADVAAAEPANPPAPIVAAPVEAPPNEWTDSAPVDYTPIPEPWPDPSYEASYDYGAPYPSDDEQSPDVLHPEVTDPAMRKLLEPAWAD
jgi:hypothetical protein